MSVSYLFFALPVGRFLLVNPNTRLAPTRLGPVVVNISLFHLLLDRSDLIVAIVVVILWGMTAIRKRQRLINTPTEGSCALHRRSHWLS